MTTTPTPTMLRLLAALALGATLVSGCGSGGDSDGGQDASGPTGPDSSLDPALVEKVDAGLGESVNAAADAMDAAGADLPTTLAELTAAGSTPMISAGTKIDFIIDGSHYCVRGYNPSSSYRGDGAYLYRSDGAGEADLPFGLCDTGADMDPAFTYAAIDDAPTDPSQVQSP